MEILAINSSKQRNEEHFQFHTGVIKLIEELTAEYLKLEDEFPPYKAAYENEAKAINVMRSSDKTDELALLDEERDSLYMGFQDAVKSALNHYIEEKRIAGTRVMKLLDFYGDVPRKNYVQQTASMNDLHEDFTGEYASDIGTLELTEWAGVLKTKNTAFADVFGDRHNETAARTVLKAKDTRKELDASYKEIVKRITAGICFVGEEHYSDFVKKLNVRIDYYNNMIAKRSGRKEEGEE